MGMGAAQHFVLSEPLLIVGPQLPKHLQPTLSVEDVVDDAFEVVRVVCVWHKTLVGLL